MQRYALIPAAGFGSRMGTDTPKQYLPLLGKPMLYYSLALLCRSPAIAKVFVVLSPDDSSFDHYDWPHTDKLVVLYCGGATRAQSVSNGLQAIGERALANDWILVHDAARPCLSEADLDTLIETLDQDEVGGLLAQPVADTIKRSDGGLHVSATEPRENLWQAQTPQMFRYATLLKALQAAVATSPTDEAGAIEGLGLRPRLVAGSSTNLKITYVEDIRLAEMILKTREDEL